MTNQDYTHALSMRNEGYSLQQIADELGMSKSSVFRLLKQENTLETDLEQEQEELQSSSFDNKHLPIKIAENYTSNEDSTSVETVKNHQTSTKQVAQADLLLRKYQKLVNSILEQTIKNSWQVSDFKNCLEQINTLKTQLEHYSFSVLAQDHEELLIWNNLNQLHKIVFDSIAAHKNALFPFFTVPFEVGTLGTAEIEAMKRIDSLRYL